MVDNVAQQTSKRRRISYENNPDTNDQLRQTKLFDLNADCLREIFQYIKLEDLVNLVEANLNDCGDSEADINERSTTINSSYEAAIRDHFLRVEGDQCSVTNDPEQACFSTRVFRHFRSLLSQISMSYYPKYHRHNIMMEQIVLKYSLDFLTEIVFDNADQCAFEGIRKPFANVKVVTFEGGYLSNTLGDFNRWFPRLEILTLNETMFSNPTFIENRFLNLKELSVKNKHLCRCHKSNWYDNVDTDFYILKNENLKSFFALNHQLETLNIFQGKFERSEFRSAPDGYYIQINQELLAFINVNMPGLRHLHLHLIDSTFSSSYFEDEIINFQSLTSLSVETSEIYRLNEIIIMSDQLVTLTLAGKSHFVRYEEISEFVGRFKNIQCLLIETLLDEIRNQHFVNMIKGLRSLVSLNITLNESNFPSDAIFCMSQFEHLRALQIRCSKIPFQHFQSFLNAINRCTFMKENRWRGVIGYQWANFIFEKY